MLLFLLLTFLFVLLSLTCPALSNHMSFFGTLAVVHSADTSESAALTDLIPDLRFSKAVTH